MRTGTKYERIQDRLRKIFGTEESLKEFREMKRARCTVLKAREVDKERERDMREEEGERRGGDRLLEGGGRREGEGGAGRNGKGSHGREIGRDVEVFRILFDLGNEVDEISDDALPERDEFIRHAPVRLVFVKEVVVDDQ